MDTSPIYVTFEFAGNLGEEVEKVKLSIKGMRDETSSTFKSLLKSSNEAFAALSEDNQKLAVAIQKDIDALRQLDALQKAMNESFEKGTMSASAYADGMAKLSIQEIDLREGIAANIKQLNEAIAADKRQTGSIEEKKAALASLEQAYAKLSETERNSEKGDALVRQIRELRTEVKSLGDVMGDATTSEKGFLDTAKALPGPLGSAASGIQSMTKAAMAFIATPLGIVLAAIAAALALVTTWFRRTEEGENALAVATAAFGQVLNSVLDVASRAGKWLYEAFTSPKQALSDLVDFMKDQLVNRLQGLAESGQALWKIFRYGDLTGFVDLGKSLLKVSTGVDDLTGKVKDFYDETKDKVKERVSLQERENQLEKDQRGFLVERAKLEDRINELRNKSYDQSLPEKERLTALKEAMNLNDQLYSKEISFAKEKYAIIKRTNELSDSNKADLQKEAEAEAEIIRLDAQRLSSRQMMLRMSNTLTNKIAKEDSKTAVDLLKEELDKKKNLYSLYYAFLEKQGKEAADKAYEGLVRDGESYREYILRQIDALEQLSSRSADENNMLAFLYQENANLEGKKTAADVLKEEIEKLKKLYGDDLVKLRAELVNIQASMSGDNSESGVQKKNVITAALDEADKDAEKKFKDLMDTYQTGFFKLIKLEEDYNRDVEFLRSRMDEQTTEEGKKRIEDAIKARSDAYAKALLKENDMFVKLFGDLTRESTRNLQNLLKFAETADLTGMTPQDIKAFQDAVRKLESELRERNPFKAMYKDFTNLMDAIKKGEGAEDALSGLDKSFKEAVDYVNQLGDSLGSVFGEDTSYAISQATELAGAVFNIGKGAAQLYSGDILGGIQSVASGVASIFSIAKKTKEMNRKAREEQQKYYDNALKGEREYNQLLRERLRLQQQIGETTLQYNKRITAELEKQGRDVQSEYNRLFSQLQGEDYISGVGYKHGTWLRKAKTWNEYESLAGKTYEDIEKLYTEGKLDEKVSSLFEQLKKLKEEGADINQMLADQAEAMREAYTGTNTNAIADSIIQGFAEGKRSAQDFANDFESMMNNAVLQGVKMQALEEPLRQWYEQFAESSRAGLTADKIAELRKQYDKIISDAAQQLSDAEKITGMSISGASASREASQKGLASMSQHSAYELEGKFTTMLIYQDKINTNVSDLKGLLLSGLDQLGQIAANTSYCQRLDNMDKTMTSVKQGVDYIVTNGLILRKE